MNNLKRLIIGFLVNYNIIACILLLTCTYLLNSLIDWKVATERSRTLAETCIQAQLS